MPHTAMTEIKKVGNTYPKNDIYGPVTESVILITQNKKTIILTPKHLKELERVLGARLVGR